MTSIAYAIDFGTTNSGIAAITSNRSVEIVPHGEKAQTDSTSEFVSPSNVYLSETGQQLSGWDALLTYLSGVRNRNEVGQYSSSLISGLKSDLGPYSDINYFSRWGYTYDLEELVAVVFRNLRKRAEDHFGDSPGAVKKLILGHPVVFVGARSVPNSIDPVLLHNAALATLENAARRVGFTQIETCDEATASTLHNSTGHGNLISMDFGGGTFDIAAAKINGSESEVYAVSGVGVGGDDIDSGIFTQVIAPRLGLGDNEDGSPEIPDLPNRYRKITTFSDYLKIVRNLDARPDISQIAERDGNERLYELIDLLEGSRGINLYRSLGLAKAKLSETQAVAIKYNISGIESKIIINRDVLQNAFNAVQDDLRVTIEGILNEMKWTHQDVDTVILTGGSSQLHCFQEMVEEMFPESVLQQNDPFTSVLHGLGLYGLGKGRKYTCQNLRMSRKIRSFQRVPS